MLCKRVRSTSHLVLALGGVAVWIAVGVASGQERQEILDGFAKLRANSLQALEQGQVETLKTAVAKGPDEKVEISVVTRAEIQAVIVAAQPVRLGLKICGQLLDAAGNPAQFVNLTKHKWQRKERFWLWVESAVPVQLAVFQNYPEGRPPSRQISPDEAYPTTFGTLLPGKPVRFPVLFQMDDDLRDEIISFVVLRADAQALPINGAVVQATATAQATTIINAPLPTGPAVRVEAGAQAQALGANVNSNGTLKGAALKMSRDILSELNTQVRARPVVKGQKLDLVGEPPAQAPAVSAESNDVAIVLLGVGRVAQKELVFHKD